MHPAPFFALLAFLAPSALAQPAINGTYVTGLVNVFHAAGLNEIAQATQSLMSTPGGQLLFGSINQGSKTLLAPIDAAFQGVPSNISNNSTLMGSILSYHLLSGSFPGEVISRFPNLTVARTFLTDPEFVHLEGNKSQAIAFAVDPTRNVTKIYNQNTDVIITSSLTYENLLIHVVNAVIDIPGALVDVIPIFGLTSFQRTIGRVRGLGDAVADANGITIFAPVNSAFNNGVDNALSELNTAELRGILGNHIINGTTVYSPLLTQGSYTSGSGSPFSFAYNTSGVFVTSGTTTAHVVQSDIILENGVMHLIDRVLFNNATNTQAAQSAYNSYTSSAAAAVTQSGNMAPTPTETGALGGTSVPSQSNSSPLSFDGVQYAAVALGVLLASAAWMI